MEKCLPSNTDIKQTKNTSVKVEMVTLSIRSHTNFANLALCTSLRPFFIFEHISFARKVFTISVLKSTEK